MKKVIWWAIIVLVVIGICFAYYYDATRPLPVDGARAEIGTIQTFVEDRARTTLPKIHRLTMPLTGRILPIELEEGDRVVQGQVVARMDTADLETAVSVAQSKVAEIQARIVLNESNHLENVALEESDSAIQAAQDTVKAAQARIVAGEEDLKFAGQWVNAKRSLGLGGDVAKLDVRAAERDYIRAKVDLATDQFIASAVKAISEAVDLGPKYVARWIDRKALEKDILIEQLTGARAELEKAKRDAGRALIESPVDGVVLSRLVDNRRILPADTPLLEIGDLSHLQITADVLSQDAVLIQPGQNVEIYGPAIGPGHVPGKVIRVDPKGLTKLSSLGVEQQRVDVKVAFEPDVLNRLKENGRTISLGYRVSVRIFTARKEKTLIIPRTALFRSAKGQWQVFTVQDQKARLVEVTVGLTNDRTAEILEGLDTGAEVIIAPPKSLTDGARVVLNP